MFYASTTYVKNTPHPELGRWHVVFSYIPDMVSRGKTSTLSIGCFKLTNLPPEGEVIQPIHYQGFLFVKTIRLSFAIEGVWNLPTLPEIRSKIKQQWVIQKSRVVRYLASLWANMRGLR